MVLPTPPPDNAPGAREASWLARLNGVLQLVQKGVLILIDQAHPERLGELVRSLLPAHPDLEVHTDAVRLARAAKGSLIILVPDPDQATWLNLERPIFANRALRVILFSTAQTSSLLARRAPDFFSWISHRIECPEGPPLPAVRGIRAALRTRARGIAWIGGDLEAVFQAALPGRALVHASAAMPYEQMVEAAKPAGKSWVAWSEVDGPFRLRRVRWATAEAGRRGRTVLVVPGVEAPGFLHVDGRLLDFKAACAELEAAGAKHAGRLAALLDLEPEAVTLAGSLLRAGNEERNIESAVRTAADPGAAINQLAPDSGTRAGATPSETATNWHDSAEALLLSRRADESTWVNRARAALEADDAEVAVFWAKKALLLPGEDREALQVAGRALERSGAYKEAESLLRRSIGIADATKKIDQVYASTLIELARALLDQGLLKDAEGFLRKAITIERKTAGVKHSGYAYAIRGLAIVLRDRGRLEEAEKLLKESVAITRHAEGKTHPNYAITIIDLGTVLLARGKRGAAEALFRESSPIIERTLGTENSHYAAAAYGLGRCLLEQHKYSDAEPSLRIAVAVHAKILGQNHPTYATSLHELGRCLAGRGAYGEAERDVRQALLIFENSIGTQNLGYATSLHELAGILLDRGDYEGAEQAFRSTLEIEQEILGNEHPALCTTLSNLGFVLANQRQSAAGEELIARSIEIAKKASSHHPSVGLGLLTLARLQATRGGIEAAETARQALAALQQSLGAKAQEYREAARLLEDLIGATPNSRR
jgi:tetratricopeptide (TPR) repeat protein